MRNRKGSIEGSRRSGSLKERRRKSRNLKEGNRGIGKGGKNGRSGGINLRRRNRMDQTTKKINGMIGIWSKTRVVLFETGKFITVQALRKYVITGEAVVC